MKQFAAFLPALALSLLLSACGSGEYSDLQQFVADSGKDLRGKVPPLPEVKPYEPYAYNAFDIPDPFKPRKPVVGKGGGNQPDLNRAKEPLESYPLESLKMVGMLQQQQVFYALIKSPDNALHRVKVGGYMGQNFGRIASISEADVTLKEIVQDSGGDWTERVSTLMLEDLEQKK